MREQFEVRLNFKPSSGSADRIFLAMAQYVSAYENLINIVGKGIDPENEVRCELSQVEIGSLRSIIDCIASARYCEILSRIPVLITSQLLDMSEIDSEGQVEDFTEKLESEIRSGVEIDFPNQTNINRLDLAKGLEKLISASDKLIDGETIDVRNMDSNVVYLNDKVRFTKKPEELFREYQEKKTVEETLLIKSPVYFGNSMWEFKSLNRGRVFSSVIEDIEWVERFQKKQVTLPPGDAILALVEYVVYKQKGSKKFEYKDYKVLKVVKPVRSIEIQDLLGLETEDEE